MQQTMKVLVEHCVAEREERHKQSISLKGDKARYTQKLLELRQVLQLELPNVPVEANSTRLFHLQETHRQQSSATRDDRRQTRPGRTHGPRLGSFEVFLELCVSDGLATQQVAAMLPLASKLQSKQWPDARRVVKLVRNTMVDTVRDLAIASVHAQQCSLVSSMMRSALQYAITPHPDQKEAQEEEEKRIDRWGEALQVETWETASVRELLTLPSMLMRSKSWPLLRHVLCSLTFLAAKTRKCGVKAVLSDLETAVALVNQHKSGPEPGVQQLGFDLSVCQRFMSKNVDALCANPASIFTRAQSFSFPGLAHLTVKFAAIFQDLQQLAQEMDADDRLSTGVDLLKFVHGVSLATWAQQSGFAETFSQTDSQWISYCCQDFQARVAVLKDWMRNTLFRDADEAAAMLQVDSRDQILGHFAPSRLFLLATKALSMSDNVDSTMRLELQSEDSILAAQGHDTVRSVLHEVLEEQNIVSVVADVLRDTEHQRKHNVYSITVGLRAVNKKRASAEPWKLQSVVSFLRDLFESEGPELTAMLPNRCKLRYIGLEREVYILFKFVLPKSMPCSKNDLHRYKEMLKEDLIESSRYELEDNSLTVLDISRCGALIWIHQDFLPPHTSTTDVAKDFVEQIESTSVSLQCELTSSHRLISLHIFWACYMYKKPPDHILAGNGVGLDSTACLFTLAESSDLGAECSFLSKFVLPALTLECKFQRVDLQYISFHGMLAGGPRNGGIDDSANELVDRARILRNFKASRKGCNFVTLGVLGAVHPVEDSFDAQMLRDDFETDWRWATVGECAQYSSSMLHLSNALSLHGQESNDGNGFAMIRRQDFGEEGQDEEFIKQVPAKVRAAFKPARDTVHAVQQLVSHLKGTLGNDRTNEYSAEFLRFGKKIGSSVDTTRSPDVLRVQQKGIEAFGIEVFEKVVKSLVDSSVAAVSARAYPWQMQELELQQLVQRRHEQSFYVEKGGRLENVIGDLVSVASSMDLSAPSLILLEGISGSGRSALLAKVASVFATNAGKQYVLYFWKPPGCKFESALAAMASLLWLQLIGGRCMHKDSNKMKWKISDVFDVIQRASARSCNESSSTYRRVVLILDGFAIDEQLDISEYLLARPSLFPLVTCILSSESVSRPVVSAKEEKAMVYEQNRIRFVRSHFHTRVIAMPRLSSTESLKLATNMLSDTIGNATDVVEKCKKELLRKDEIWRPSYVRCLVQSMLGTSGSSRLQALEEVSSTRELVFDSVITNLNEAYGREAVGELLCSLLSTSGSRDCELRERYCLPQGRLTDRQLLSIMQALQPFFVVEQFWRDGSAILTEECWAPVIRRYVIPSLDALKNSDLDIIAHQCRGAQQQILHTASQTQIDYKSALQTELPDDIGTKLSHYWQQMEKEAYSDDAKRHRTSSSHRRHAEGNKTGKKVNVLYTHNDTSWSFDTSVGADLLRMDRPGEYAGPLQSESSKLGRTHEGLSPLPTFQEATGRYDHEGIVSTMMQELMATSNSTFGNRVRMESDTLIMRQRPRSATRYRDSKDTIRRPMSAGPKFSGQYSFTGRSASRLSSASACLQRDNNRDLLWPQQRRDSSMIWTSSPSVRADNKGPFDNSLEEMTSPYLKPEWNRMMPRRLHDNWVDLDPHMTMSRSPGTPKHIAASENVSSSSLRTRDGTQKERLHAGIGTAEEQNRDSTESIEVIDDSRLGSVGESEDLSDQYLVEHTQRRSNQDRVDRWQSEQADRAQRQAERTRQLARACQVRDRADAAWNQRHKQLAQENKTIRSKQELIHAHEASPFVKAKTGTFRGNDPVLRRPRVGTAYTEERWMYAGLQKTDAVKRARAEARERRLQKAQQLAEDLIAWRTHVISANPVENAAAERREFGKLVALAVASPEAFAKFEAELEREKRAVLRRQELQQRDQQRRLALEDQATEEKKLRIAVHEGHLVARHGMEIVEQVELAKVGVSENLQRFGVRIRRPGTPETVKIGSRRLGRVKVPRMLVTSRGESFPKIVHTIVSQSFIIQVLPVEGRCKFLESKDCFVGAYKLRIRYHNIIKYEPKRGTEAAADEDPEGDEEDSQPLWQGPMRQKPIVLRIAGSDGYLGVWTEQPVGDAAVKFKDGLIYSYRGVLETDTVPEAELGIEDSLHVRGVNDSERADTQEDVIPAEAFLVIG